MRNIGLLTNPGGYDGTSGELSDEEKKRLRAMAALQMGASMLANNQGNYGAFAPVLGVGLQNGLASYQLNLERMKKDLEQQKRMEVVNYFRDLGLIKKDLTETVIEYLGEHNKLKLISAARSVAPVSGVSSGVPVTTTASLNVTVIVIKLPVP